MHGGFGFNSWTFYRPCNYKQFTNLLFDLEISEFKSTYDDYMNMEWNIIRKKAAYLNHFYDERAKAEKKKALARKNASKK